MACHRKCNSYQWLVTEMIGAWKEWNDWQEIWQWRIITQRTQTIIKIDHNDVSKCRQNIPPQHRPHAYSIGAAMDVHQHRGPLRNSLPKTRGSHTTGQGHLHWTIIIINLIFVFWYAIYLWKMRELPFHKYT